MVTDNLRDKFLITIHKYLRYIGKETKMSDVFLSIVYVLYGIHKQYQAIKSDNSGIVFKKEEDCLLNDLYECTIGENQQIQLYNLYRDLSFINHNDFEKYYVDILASLISWQSLTSESSNQEEFYTPAHITALMAYLVNAVKAKSIFDPFCGTSSIVHRLSKDVLFEGQEQNRHLSLLARVNLEAFYGFDNNIKCCDSIIEWSDKKFDAVVTCPPFSLRFSENQRQIVRNGQDDLNSDLEELLFSRAFNKNNAKTVISLEPIGFCYSQQNLRLRQYLVDKNYLDCIVFLPKNMLYGTSISCVIIICKKNRASDEPIKFIDALSYFVGDSIKERWFDYDRFINSYENNADNFSFTVSHKEIVSYDYNFNIHLYNQKLVKLEEGQQIYALRDLLTEVRKLDITPSDNHKVFMRNQLSSDYDEVLLKRNVLIPYKEAKRVFLRKLVPVKEGVKYLLSLSGSGAKPQYAIYTQKETFSCIPGIKVFAVNENIVSPEYLIYILINNPVLKSGYGLLSQYMMLPIVVDSKDNQIELVRKKTQQFAAQKDAEIEADKKRLGVKSNISDLEHMLGTTYANIDKLLYKLEKLQSEDDTLHFLVKGLKDNVDYLKRVVQYDNANISSEEFNFKELDIEEFIKSYCNGWINYSGNYFGLSLKINLGDNKKVLFDKTLLKVMLDSVLTNVERHGFDKRRNDSNHVEISLSIERYGYKPYVVIRVSNNGAPFKQGFTINDYITRGRYSASTGRSGLGGYHVYSIIKGHGGYLYIDSNKIWNVIIEMLLPIENVELDNLIEYENECI